MHEQHLKTIDSPMYLGIEITKDLKWRETLINYHEGSSGGAINVFPPF